MKLKANISHGRLSTKTLLQDAVCFPHIRNRASRRDLKQVSLRLVSSRVRHVIIDCRKLIRTILGSPTVTKTLKTSFLLTSQQVHHFKWGRAHTQTPNCDLISLIFHSNKVKSKTPLFANWLQYRTYDSKSFQDELWHYLPICLALLCCSEVCKTLYAFPTAARVTWPAKTILNYLIAYCSYRSVPKQIIILSLIHKRHKSTNRVGPTVAIWRRH